MSWSQRWCCCWCCCPAPVSVQPDGGNRSHHQQQRRQGQRGVSLLLLCHKTYCCTHLQFACATFGSYNILLTFCCLTECFWAYCVFASVSVGCNGVRVRISMMRWFLLTGDEGKARERENSVYPQTVWCVIHYWSCICANAALCLEQEREGGVENDCVQDRGRKIKGEM